MLLKTACLTLLCCLVAVGGEAEEVRLEMTENRTMFYDLSMKTGSALHHFEMTEKASVDGAATQPLELTITQSRPADMDRMIVVIQHECRLEMIVGIGNFTRNLGPVYSSVWDQRKADDPLQIAFQSISHSADAPAPCHADIDLWVIDMVPVPQVTPTPGNGDVVPRPRSDKTCSFRTYTANLGTTMYSRLFVAEGRRPGSTRYPCVFQISELSRDDTGYYTEVVSLRKSKHAVDQSELRMLDLSYPVPVEKLKATLAGDFTETAPVVVLLPEKRFDSLCTNLTASSSLSWETQEVLDLHKLYVFKKKPLDAHYHLGARLYSVHRLVLRPDRPSTAYIFAFRVNSARCMAKNLCVNVQILDEKGYATKEICKPVSQRPFFGNFSSRVQFQPVPHRIRVDLIDPCVRVGVFLKPFFAESANEWLATKRETYDILATLLVSLAAIFGLTILVTMAFLLKTDSGDEDRYTLLKQQAAPKHVNLSHLSNGLLSEEV